MNEPRRFIYTCDKCKRTVMASNADEFWLWLTSGPPLARKLVVRCPQHITEWALRRAGYPRTAKVRRWAAYAKTNDPAKHRPVSEFISPYPAGGPFK